MKGLSLILLLSINCLYGQVGINTINPQQALHIANNNIDARYGRMRVESLDATNNDSNAGDLNGDGNLTNDFYPLGVDENGDFTLEFGPSYNSGDVDALDDNNLPTSTVFMPSTDSDGNASTNIVSYTITVGRATILEVKYNISFDVYSNPAKDKITDNLARRVVTYFDISNSSRAFGPSSSNYSSGSIESVVGTLHNSSSAYIVLPWAGTFTLTLVGTVSANLKAAGVAGDPTESTYVEFATGHDFVFIRYH